ncbi:MAG: 6-carboxytetrahydropterin synthase [Candidatus Sumerlaeia bacterium]|nr:6-carboxytetrahydropterin synthase [Candidatus Sumerlaeia bacterium]
MLSTRERVTVTAHFHAGHRQLDYPGKCEWIHGHTWRARIVVSADELPRDNIDMSLDFGELKAYARDLDHKFLVSASDARFLDPGQFDPKGVVVIPGAGPSVENVTLHIFENVLKHIETKFPGRGVTYTVSVELQETDNNFFEIQRVVTI